MYREVLEKLVEWKEREDRKILLVEGTRGVGKTYILKDFGEGCFDNVAVIDLKGEAYIKEYFSGGLKKERFNSILEMTAGRIEKENTLIIIENMDMSEKLCENIRMLKEEFGDYCIAVTFSGREEIVVEQNGLSGEDFQKIKILPLNFKEFLTILKRTDLCEKIENHRKNPINEKDMDELKTYIKKYLYIGGMPSVVQQYIDTGDMELVEKEKEKIMDSYIAEIQSIADKPFRKKVLEVWKSVPEQLKKENKKFQYGVVKLTARAREYSDSVKWLVDHKYIDRVFRA